MLNRLFILLIGIALVGCSGESEVESDNVSDKEMDNALEELSQGLEEIKMEVGNYKLAENGDTLYKTRVKDSTDEAGYFDTYREWYSPDGKLLATETYREADDRKFGTKMTYFKNGKIKDSCDYFSDVKRYCEHFYFNGRVKSVEVYTTLLIGEMYVEHLDQYGEYDLVKGEAIKEKSFFYYVSLSKDSIDEGDMLDVEITLSEPRFDDSAYVEIGEYDTFYRITNKDKKNIRNIPVIDGKVKFSMEARKNQEGYNAVVGILHDFDTSDELKHHKYYIREKYYVR